MTAWLAARSAWQALRVNMLRTLLTMLGVIIGVAAVITMVALGRGAQDRVAEQIRSLGASVIVIRSGAVAQGGANLGRGSRRTITEDDAQAIATEIETAAAVAPMVRGRLQVEAGSLNSATTVQGVTPEYFEVRDWGAMSGRLFDKEDVDGATKVAVLGHTVAEDLFPGGDAAGQVIRVNRVPFTVLGVLGPKGQSNSGDDQDDVILIPITTAKMKVLGTSRSVPTAVYAITVKVAEGRDMAVAEQQIRELLRQRHRLRPRDDDDFRLKNLADVADAEEESSRVLTLLLASIASVSLVVGGIGIMNIMLVTVVERTREIGLRMAVGARGRDILAQFLLEAVTLSLIGGGLGAALGVGASVGLAYLSDWPVVIQVQIVAIAVSFAAVVGVFFGFYPARKAARLDPIAALRYE